MKRITNNPNRAHMNFGLPRSRGQRQTPLRLPKLGIRRIMKRDPSKGIESPAFDKITDTPGVSGLSGATGARTVVKARQGRFGAGKKVIQNRGVNRSLKKR